jgi:hypothetical protein
MAAARYTAEYAAERAAESIERREADVGAAVEQDMDRDLKTVTATVASHLRAPFTADHVIGR